MRPSSVSSIKRLPACLRRRFAKGQAGVPESQLKPLSFEKAIPDSLWKRFPKWAATPPSLPGFGAASARPFVAANP